jgi:predicted nucleic-acid-binding protein
MTGNKIVVDTNIFIDLMKGDETIAHKIRVLFRGINFPGCVGGTLFLCLPFCQS